MKILVCTFSIKDYLCWHIEPYSWLERKKGLIVFGRNLEIPIVVATKSLLSTSSHTDFGLLMPKQGRLAG